MRFEGGSDRGPPGESQDGAQRTPEDLRERSRANTERLVAAAMGAVEGIVEGLRRENIGDKTSEAIHESGRLVRGTTREFKKQAETPEGQALAEDMRRLNQQAQHQVENVKQSVQETQQQAKDQVQTLREDAMQRYESGKQMVVERVDQVKQTAEEVRDKAVELKDETKARAQAVAESGRRAKEAPAVMVRDVKEAARSYVGGVTKALAFYTVAGVIAIAALVVLTVALVTGINIWLGAPWGAFITAGLYLAAAAGAAVYAKAAKAEGKEEARERIDHIRTEAQYVARPAKQAFSRNGPPPKTVRRATH